MILHTYLGILNRVDKQDNKEDSVEDLVALGYCPDVARGMLHGVTLVLPPSLRIALRKGRVSQSGDSRLTDEPASLSRERARCIG